MSVTINFIVIPMKVLSAFQFVIVGTFGETHQTDIAVDAVCVLPCGGEKMSLDHVIYVKKKIKTATYGNFIIEWMAGKAKKTWIESVFMTCPEPAPTTPEPGTTTTGTTTSK